MKGHCFCIFIVVVVLFAISLFGCFNDEARCEME